MQNVDELEGRRGNSVVNLRDDVLNYNIHFGCKCHKYCAIPVNLGARILSDIW